MKVRTRPSGSEPGRASGRRDLIVIALGSLAVFLVGVAFNLFDRADGWLDIHSVVATDDIFALSVILTIAFVIFSIRRWRQASNETARREETENRYRTIVERVPAVSYVWDTANAPGSASASYISPQIERLLGYTAEEWLADPGLWDRHVHPDDRSPALAAWDRAVAAGRPFSLEYRMRRVDDRPVWVRDEAVPVSTGPVGTPVYQGVMFDISEQKRAEERYRLLVEQLPVVSYISDSRLGNTEGHRLRYMAPGIGELTGYPAEEWLAGPGTWERMIHPDDRRRVMEEDGRTDDTGERFEIEYRLIRSDGGVVWVRDTSVLVERDDDQTLTWQGVIQDITARREAELLLSEAEQRFRVLVEQIPAVTFIEEPGTGITRYISPQIEHMFGYTPEEWLADQHLWEKRLHPEDRDRVLEHEREDDRWNMEYRILTKDARVAWVRNEAVLVRNQDDSPRFWLGVVVDVTDSKQAEERLLAAQHRYQSLVERLPVTVYIDALDDVSTAKYVSPQYEQLTGYSAEERMAESELWVRMLHPEDREWVLAESIRTNATSDPWDLEYRIVRKDGRTVWVHDKAFVVSVPDGDPVWQGVLTDITEQKLAQESLSRRDRILEAVGRAAERFLGASSWLEAMDEVLAHLGMSGGASRAAIYRHELDGEGRECVGMVREWAAPGIRPLAPIIEDNLYPFEEVGLSRWLEVFDAGGMIHGLTAELPEGERAVLEGAGVRALVVIPIVAGGGRWGHLVYDQCEEDRIWHQAELDALRVVAQTLGAAIGREQAARKLSEAEERYRRLVEQIPAVTYIDECPDDSKRRWSTTYISPQVQDILGYSPEEWCSNPDLWPSRIHEDDRDQSLEADRRHYETGEPLAIELRMHAKDGSIRWIRDEAIMIRDEEGRSRWSQGILLDITNRKLSEQQLHEADERYRSLIETIPAATYVDTVDATSKAIYMSPQVEEIFGYTPEEWKSRPELWEQGVDPEDLPDALRQIERLNREGTPYKAEYRFRRPDGRTVWVQDQAVVIRDEDGNPRFCQGVMFDVTERREAEEQLRTTEERFRAIVEHVPAAIYLNAPDSSMQTLYVSPQVEDITGLTAEEWTGNTRAWLEALHPDDREAVLARYLECIGSFQAWSDEYRIKRRDGRTIWVHDETTFLHDEEGDPSVMLGVMFDVTERKLAEQALRESEQREREAAERLRALDEMKNTFLAAVSHELRSPLTSILGLSLTLERAELGEDDRNDLLERLAANARKLDRLLRDLLDIDRLNRGIVEPQYRVTDVGALARRTVESLDPLSDRSVTTHADPVVVPVDPAKVERIVENLLMNAARHTTGDRTIWLRVEAWNGGVLIAVEDDGPGVPDEIREAIFEPFRQGPTASPHSPGTGIGLSLVARFAELHGGRAWVEERDGGGASFRVFLPGGPDDDALPGADDAQDAVERAEAH